MVTRLKKTFTAIPESIRTATTYLISIGETQKKINQAKQKANKEITTIKAVLEQELAPLITERNTFFTALYAFAQGNKAELTIKQRSVKTTHGSFGLRWTPPYVEVEDKEGNEAVIAYQRAHKLDRYLRVTYELNKEAMLAEQPEIPGVSYTTREEFFAKPKLLKVEGKAEELAKALEDQTEAIDV